MPLSSSDTNGHAVARANGAPPVLTADDCGALASRVNANALPLVLEEGEAVQRQSRAAVLRRPEAEPALVERLLYPLTAGLRSHQGVLSLTAKRLVFTPLNYQDQALAIETHLHRLSGTGVSRAGLRRTLTVNLTRGARYEFVVAFPEHWAADIATVAGLPERPSE